MRPLRLFALAAALVLATAACSGASPTPAASAPAAAPSAAGSAAGGSAAGGNAVTIANFAFAPTSVTVAVGSSVTWSNNDSTAHTVTADDGSFDSSNVAPGSTFSQTFSKAGTFAYHCKIHPSMKATVVVQ